MNAYIQLALIEKAKRVFASGAEVTLSFPLLSPIAFTASELESLTGLPQSAADYAAAADFARSVNFIPRDLVASSSEQMLWDVYRDVLARAEVAVGEAGSGPAAASSGLLYIVAPDGSRTESDALRQYRQYRDAWFVASEDYATRRLSGELSADPAIQQRWRDVEEPVVRAALDDAHNNWLTLGRKLEIEQALAAEKAAASRSPDLRWAEWRKAFDPDIDLLTEAGGNQYAPTGLSPRNFAEQDGWLSFELSAGEMDALVAEAPEALKSVLGGAGRGAVESVSFRYRSVALVRSWFRPEALVSRIWRSDQPELQLSDGGDPPTGTCPAYATACVFVRDVEIVESGVRQTPPAQSGLFTLDAQLLTRRALVADPALLARAARQRGGVAAPAAPQPVSMRAFEVMNRNSIVALARPKRAVFEETLSAEELREIAPAMRFLRKRRPFEMAARVNRGAFVAHGPTPEPAPPIEPAPPPRDEISVLAFICKRLPKAPDPAPDLHWI